MNGPCIGFFNRKPIVEDEHQAEALSLGNRKFNLSGDRVANVRGERKLSSTR